MKIKLPNPKHLSKKASPLQLFVFVVLFILSVSGRLIPPIKPSCYLDFSPFGTVSGSMPMMMHSGQYLSKITRRHVQLWRYNISLHVHVKLDDKQLFTSQLAILLINLKRLHTASFVTSICYLFFTIQPLWISLNYSNSLLFMHVAYTHTHTYSQVQQREHHK